MGVCYDNFVDIGSKGMNVPKLCLGANLIVRLTRILYYFYGTTEQNKYLLLVHFPVLYYIQHVAQETLVISHTHTAFKWFTIV